MGLCLSYSATITAVKRMGVNHDKLVLDWTKSVSSYTSNEETDTETGCASCDITDGNDDDDIDDDIDVDDIDVDDIDVIPEAGEEECDIPTDRSLFIIGDNWDKNIKPRADMRMNNQVKSLHLFHSIAAVSRIETLHLDDIQSIGSVKDIPVSDFLPSVEDCKAICENYVTLAARVITENFNYFKPFHNCVPTHIHHEYSAEMAEKTTMVSVVRPTPHL